MFTLSYCKFCYISFYGTHCPSCNTIAHSATDLNLTPSADPNSIHFSSQTPHESQRNQTAERTKELALNIDGIWWNEDRQLIILIDKPSRFYRSWHPKRENIISREIDSASIGGSSRIAYLNCYDLKIKLQALDNGRLLMSLDGMKLEFWILKKAQLQRLCPVCFQRTEAVHTSCNICKHDFGEVFPGSMPSDPILQLAHRWSKWISE